jgi:hypothetical protein
MPRDRRLIRPGTAGGVLLLALLIAMILVGTLVAERNSIAGEPVTMAIAEDLPVPVVPHDDRTPATPPPAATETPVAPPAAETPDNPGPGREPAAQASGTVRLAHGGTAKIVRREIGDDGVLPIPNAINQASWWGVGMDAPAGAMVLAGHVNWKGATGPFAELWDARPGDPVSMVDQSGRPLAYRVAQVITLAKDELPHRAEELFAQSGPHRLVLVTCGGQWVGGKIGYASNQIVIAAPLG